MRKEDRHLQVLHIGGRFFVEEKVTFGCVSSPGHFEKPSWFLLKAAIVKAGAERRNAVKQVDDACVFSEVGDEACSEVYRQYRMMAPRMGVKLAPESDPEKAFPPSTAGVCLGVMLDLAKWQWAIPAKKVRILRYDLNLVATQKEVENGKMEQLSGRLNHYGILVAGGTWERSFLIHIHKEDKPKSWRVSVTAQARMQAEWWLRALPAAVEMSRILDLAVGTKCHVDLNIYPDAAGGSKDSPGNGAGAVIWETGQHYAQVWPENIQQGTRNGLGAALDRKLTTLEGVAALFALVMDPGLVKMKTVAIWTDNAGLVWAVRNKGSRCPYAYTVAKALADVAAGLDVLLYVKKTPRCSGRAEMSADALSKSDFKRFRENCRHRRDKQSFVSPVLLEWLADPAPTRQLGAELLLEMETRGTQVLWWDSRPKRKGKN